MFVQSVPLEQLTQVEMILLERVPLASLHYVILMNMSKIILVPHVHREQLTKPAMIVVARILIAQQSFAE
jgi:hypothetical protein